MIATKDKRTEAARQIGKATAATEIKPVKPTLEDVVNLIRQDASKHNIAYLVRSNTAHDGE